MKNILKEYAKTRDLLEEKMCEIEEQMWTIERKFSEEYFEV